MTSCPAWCYHYRLATGKGTEPPPDFSGLTSDQINSFAQVPSTTRQEIIAPVQRELANWPKYSGPAQVDEGAGIFERCEGFLSGVYSNVPSAHHRWAAQRELVYSVLNSESFNGSRMAGRKGRHCSPDEAASNSKSLDTWSSTVRGTTATSEWGELVAARFAGQPTVVLPAGLQILIRMESRATLDSFLNDPVAFISSRKNERNRSDGKVKLQDLSNDRRTAAAEETQRKALDNTDPLAMTFDAVGILGTGRFPEGAI